MHQNCIAYLFPKYIKAFSEMIQSFIQKNFLLEQIQQCFVYCWIFLYNKYQALFSLIQLMKKFSHIRLFTSFCLCRPQEFLFIIIITGIQLYNQAIYSMIRSLILRIEISLSSGITQQILRFNLIVGIEYDASAKAALCKKLSAYYRILCQR